MEATCIKECDNTFEANMFKSKLEDAGIYCFLQNENNSNIIPNAFFNKVKVMVKTYEIQLANQILKSED